MVLQFTAFALGADGKLQPLSGTLLRDRFIGFLLISARQIGLSLMISEEIIKSVTEILTKIQTASRRASPMHIV